MRRVILFALVLGLSQASAAVAEETLLASAQRLARDLGRAPATVQTTAAAAPRSAFALAQPGGAPALATSGMRKRTKALIWLTAGVGFVATVYTIDHKVVDNTLSSLGTRKD